MKNFLMLLAFVSFFVVSIPVVSSARDYQRGDSNNFQYQHDQNRGRNYNSREDYQRSRYHRNMRDYSHRHNYGDRYNSRYNYEGQYYYYRPSSTPAIIFNFQLD